MEQNTMWALPVDPEDQPAPAAIANQLDCSSFEVGVTRLFVELVGDGLATGVRVPILVARGAHPGPVFGLTSGVHGNEVNGIPVIHELFRSLDVDNLHGMVVGVIAVNVPSLHAQQREFIDGADLNRIMPGNPHGNVSQVYAHRVLDRILKELDYLLDLHTASFGRINSLYVRADMSDPATAAMAYLQQPQIIVHIPASDSTVRGAVRAMGIPVITVEIGDPQRWQAEYVRHALAGVRAVCDWIGVTEHPKADLENTLKPVICESSSWMYTDRGGLLEVYPELTEWVEEGQLIATVRNAFGDVIREYRAPRRAIVVGKSTNPVGFTGARIVHLGIEASPDSGLVTRRDCGLRSGGSPGA